MARTWSRSDLVLTLGLLVFVSLASHWVTENWSFAKYAIALVSLSCIVATDSSSSEVAPSTVFPGIVMSVTVPAALLHLQNLSTEFPTRSINASFNLLQIAASKELAALPFFICLLTLLFNPQRTSFEKSIFLSAVLALIVYILDLNARWVLVLTAVCYSILACISRISAHAYSKFELLLLQFGLGIITEELLSMHSGATPDKLFASSTAMHLVSMGILYTICFGVFMSTIFSSFPALMRTHRTESGALRLSTFTAGIIASSFLIFVLILLHAMGHYLGVSALYWVLNLVIVLDREGFKIMTCLLWCCSIAAAIGIAQRSTTSWKWSEVSSRKIFHLFATSMFVPPLLRAEKDDDISCFVALAFGVATCVFLLIEFLRAFLNSAKTGQILTFPALDDALSYFRLFEKHCIDKEKSSPTFILDHITLLLACALPVWMSTSSTFNRNSLPLLPYLGCLSVGVGDAVGALVGVNYGKVRWSSSSGRTVEGSVAALCSMLIMGSLIELYCATEGVKICEILVLVCSALFIALVEAFTSENDNIVLVLFAVTSYQALSLWSCEDRGGGKGGG